MIRQRSRNRRCHSLGFLTRAVLATVYTGNPLFFLSIPCDVHTGRHVETQCDGSDLCLIINHSTGQRDALSWRGGQYREILGSAVTSLKHQPWSFDLLVLVEEKYENHQGQEFCTRGTLIPSDGQALEKREYFSIMQEQFILEQHTTHYVRISQIGEVCIGRFQGNSGALIQHFMGGKKLMTNDWWMPNLWRYILSLKELEIVRVCLRVCVCVYVLVAACIHSHTHICSVILQRNCPDSFTWMPGSVLVCLCQLQTCHQSFTHSLISMMAAWNKLAGQFS